MNCDGQNLMFKGNEVNSKRVNELVPIKDHWADFPFIRETKSGDPI
jgi:hypothetical protein